MYVGPSTVNIQEGQKRDGTYNQSILLVMRDLPSFYRIFATLNQCSHALQDLSGDLFCLTSTLTPAQRQTLLRHCQQRATVLRSTPMLKDAYDASRRAGAAPPGSSGQATLKQDPQRTGSPYKRSAGWDSLYSPSPLLHPIPDDDSGYSWQVQDFEVSAVTKALLRTELNSHPILTCDNLRAFLDRLGDASRDVWLNFMQEYVGEREISVQDMTQKMDVSAFK